MPFRTMMTSMEVPAVRRDEPEVAIEATHATPGHCGPRPARVQRPYVVVSSADARTSPAASSASAVKMYRCGSAPGGGHGPP